MLYFTSLLLLVIAVSLDGFGVGVSYGMRKIRVPFSALTIIVSCSGIIVLASMLIGRLLSTFIPIQLTQIMGGLILIFLGIFVLLQTLRSKQSSLYDKENMNDSQGKLESFKKVLKSPDKADLDRSGTISSREAILLGIALALDAFAAGLGAAMLGFSPILVTVLIASMSGLFVFSGMKIGLLLSKSFLMQRLTYIPPLLLITLGLSNML